MTPAIIHLDGPDKSGKDTIRKELLSRSGGNYLVVNRSFLSQIVYGSIYSRNIDSIYFYNKAVEAYRRGEFLFYLRPNDLSEIQRRFEFHNEKDLKFSDFERHLRAFDAVVTTMKKMGCDYIEVDTTFYNINACSLIIEDKIKEVK